MNKDRHSVIVLEANADSIITAKGNVGGTIRWGNKRSKYDVMRKINYYYIRYPENYIRLVKKINEKSLVIIIDNSDITKTYSKKMKAFSDARDSSTGEIKKGYLTIETAVLSNGSKMLLPVYEKVVSTAVEDRRILPF